jgi:hypothetical protein
MPIKFMSAEETLTADDKTEPIPGDKPRRRGRPPGSKTGAKSTAAIETQIRDELTMLGGLAAMLWSTRDPVCGGALAQQHELIAADLAKFAAKSKFARRYLERVADIGEILPMVMHIYPVVQAIHEHHVKPKMEARRNMMAEQNVDDVVYDGVLVP